MTALVAIIKALAELVKAFAWPAAALVIAWLSGISALIAIAALIYTIARDRRDRPILKARCERRSESPEQIPALLIHAVNLGQRPIALRSLSAKRRGEWRSLTLKNDGGVVLLGQNELYEQDIMEALNILEWSADSWPESLWFEDSNGKRYHVKDSEKWIKKLWQK